MRSISSLPRFTDIPQEVFDAVAEDCGEPFAISYLSGATSRRGVLIPWTETAWLKLKANGYAMAAIARADLRLEKPYPFGHPDHPASQRSAA